MIVFGPIPSRRLGRSLGINNIPPKICSYSCVYCQLGLTDSMSITRKEFYSPNEIFKEVSEKVKRLHEAGERIDYLTFVPDGEPTIDINLGKEILLLKTLKLKVAVITNASLLWDESVREDLMNADWVSVKIDTLNDEVWHKVNRPNRKLEFQEILSGIKLFASSFSGKFVTETMLVKGINDTVKDIKRAARFIEEIKPDKLFILVPIRPPAEKFAKVPTEEDLNKAYQIFHSQINNTELLTYSEGTNFTYTSNAKKELLSILAVHPMRRDAVIEFMKKAGEDNGFLNSLIESKNIKEVKHNNNIYYVKSIRR